MKFSEINVFERAGEILRDNPGMLMSAAVDAAEREKVDALQREHSVRPAPKDDDGGGTFRPWQRSALRDAADAVDDVLRAMDMSRSMCESCGLAHYNDFDQFNASKQLEAISAKLRRFGAK